MQPPEQEPAVFLLMISTQWADETMAWFEDTIFALSSGALPSGVAVVRASGPHVLAALERLGLTGIVARRASLRTIRTAEGLPLDQAVVVYFDAPNTFTGEDVLELHLHGGRAVVHAVLNLLGGFDGFRLAAAGEFTRRAFENGRMDLVEVEGVSDLLTAETEMQRRLAMEQARGGQSALYIGWMTELTRCRALIEAELDFPEEEDIPGSVSDQVWQSVNRVATEMELHLRNHGSAEIIRDGFKVVIVGRPNSGKSSLLNALAQRDVAIVTDIAGTTRDSITVDLNLGGYLVKLTDTAGLRQADDMIEAEGMRRTRAAALDADLLLNLRDISDQCPLEAIDSDAEQIVVQTKCDDRTVSQGPLLHISVASNWGLDQLIAAIELRVSARLGSGMSDLLPARRRHVELLQQSLALMTEAHDELISPLEIRAEKLRLAAVELGRITGFVDSDDLLSVIFSEFCIGK
jgi:tRNA modification GTPase